MMTTMMMTTTMMTIMMTMIESESSSGAFLTVYAKNAPICEILPLHLLFVLC